jgi:peptidyl-prolyl cis-trans isomerase SurA
MIRTFYPLGCHLKRHVSLPFHITLTACIAASLSCVALAAPQPTKAAATEVVIDAVVASVDEKPITLSELESRLSPPRKLGLQDVAKDQEAQQILEAMIAERVLEAEASAKRVSVADAEVEEYINEVASRNSLSRTDFEAILKKEGKSLGWYKSQVKNEITKTKLAGTISRGGVSVSEQEIDEYLSNSPSFQSEGASVKLRLISISAAGKSPEELANKVKAVEDELESGKKFEEVARKYSEGPHSAEGGLLGVVAEKDLSSQIFDAVLSVEPGSYTKAVVSEQETQFFFVEERYKAKDSDEDEEDEETLEAKREEARKAIQMRKTEEKLNSYFTVELNKNHTVDKKM